MRFPLWVRLVITFAILSVARVIVLTREQRRRLQRDFLGVRQSTGNGAR
ncbi:MAG: hypothetical protein ING64_12670 [Rhodocyclaceae bacterium]|jgi:hypothetical protein|nr:hypothetical protein [Rhodocyclaceae bacterium]MCA3043237.1 hypothetical protein [Rhodocyclaceae bacterium]MCA3051614.1 hypothetical protein [Rhodocyclaceae bacterium]MCA3057192.1 hypothetical protein [Rhodocyclaceae bacterium]